MWMNFGVQVQKMWMNISVQVQKMWMNTFTPVALERFVFKAGVNPRLVGVLNVMASLTSLC